jgi:hypothetical protein
MRPAFVVAAMLLFALADASAEGGGGRQRSGAQNPRCGADLVVILPDGQKRHYASVQDFIDTFEKVRIDLGEKEREAVPVDVVLKAFSATWLEALDCDNHSLHLPSGLPYEGREYLVSTGKRGLKAVREVRRGNYRNTAQQIRKLTLHKVSSPAK